ncbi:MAG: 2,3-bisphosphoglycerate-independent phosphoglycerate mutase [Gammaproteobacteria bacterium]
MPNAKHPVMLIVLDGWGHSESVESNAILAARTPVWDRLWAECPHLLIRCSGTDVGLPDQHMGNSEVGHMHLGAGRLIDQDFSRIGKAVANGEFLLNPVLGAACEKAAAGDRAVHILGLASPGGVHSHEDHILALMDLAHARGVKRIYVHAFLDGRDMPPKSAAPTLARLSAKAAALGTARVASIVGRYFAMDRNGKWERVQPAYELIVDGVAAHGASDAVAGLEAAYARGESDEFVQATVIVPPGAMPHRVEDGDVVLFANFRADRARQITTALTAADFDHFPRCRVPALGAYVCMTNYGEQFHLPVAYDTEDLVNTFGAVVAAHGLRQLRIAETEKYAHVTFFFNGGEERVFEGEDRVMVPSPNVATYDLAPGMSAAEVTDKLVAALSSDTYDAIICNYANADMVGHTGNFDATVQCIEVLDACLGRVLAAARAHGVDVLITADHGNAEKMSEGAEAHTAHTNNVVPLVYVGRAADAVADGSLADVAPTMLTLMGLEIPREMTGHSLLRLRASAQHAA